MTQLPLQETLMNDLGLGELPEDEKAALAEEIVGLVFQGTMLRVFDLLSEPQQEELAELFNASSSAPDDLAKHDAILAYLKGAVPNLDAIVAEEIQNLKAEYAATDISGATDDAEPDEG